MNKTLTPYILIASSKATKQVFSSSTLLNCTKRAQYKVIGGGEYAYPYGHNCDKTPKRILVKRCGLNLTDGAIFWVCCEDVTVDKGGNIGWADSWAVKVFALIAVAAVAVAAWALLR